MICPFCRGRSSGFPAEQVARPNADCAHAYGYYDHRNQWHANSVGAGMAQGYYDHDGQWIEGAPNGYYDQGDRWVASNASGYYGADGRWVSGPASGAYDARGRWMPGAANGHRDAGGLWVTDAAPGYYDGAGHWRSGAVRGRYNERGVWVSAANAGDYVTEAGNPAHRELRVREAWMEQRIRASTRNGDISRRDGRRALTQLNGVRQREADLRNDGGSLSRDDEAMLQTRLDHLGASLRLSEVDARASF